MSTLSNYRKEAKKMFILSVKKDLEKWTKETNYYSPNYNNSNFIIDRYDFFNLLKITSGRSDCERVCLINWLFIPFDIKIFYYYIKLKKHFRQVRRDKKVAENIHVIKLSLENMKPEFLKDIRKEKLEKLK